MSKLTKEWIGAGVILVEALRDLARQGVVVIVTHDQGIARQADARIELEDGRIVRM